MPGFETHYIFGVSSYKNMPDTNLKKIIYDNKRVYSLGLQGPDLFFYYLPSYIVHKNNIGSLAHSAKVGQFFENYLYNLEQIKKQSHRDIGMAYLAGILGHYTLDYICHPYIYYQTDFKQKTNKYYGRHMDFETKINQLLLKQYKHIKPSQFSRTDTLKLTKKEVYIISRLLYLTYKQTYSGYHISFAMMVNAVNYFNKCLNLLNDPSGKKKKIINTLEKLFLGYSYFSTLISTDEDVDCEKYYNLSHRQWKNPWNTKLVSNASFIDLFKDAKTSFVGTLNLLNKYNSSQIDISQSYNELINNIGNRSYHSGLDCHIPS